MGRLFNFLCVSVLLLSLSLVVLLMTGFRQRQHAALPAETRRALVVAPTRPPSTVGAVPTATVPPPTLTPAPALPTEIVVTPGIAAPRVIMILNTVPSHVRLSNYCTGLGSPVSLRLFDWTTGSTVSLTNAAIAGIPLGWDASASIWQGYQALKPFNQPDDTTRHWRLNLFLADGRERWIDILASPQTPDQYYVYVFERTDPFADARGERYGYHPCRAFSVAASEVEAFLSRIDQYQDVVRYPPLLKGDDARWIHGNARPVAINADLRSIPTADYNDPIGSIDQSTDLWYALDPAWGNWAQVKLGLVQGWVDTGLVALVPEE
jgi:hypothetical protein